MCIRDRLHAGNDAVLRPGSAGEHEQYDADSQRCGAEAEGADEVAEGEQQDDDGAGDESFMMQDVETCLLYTSTTWPAKVS